ncbi:MAG: DUF2207 domain-containing protein [Gammaproteobacteria bacterium]|nr:DUF2207 domain-containing protein [Gammaproteobacteria bacterium]
MCRDWIKQDLLTEKAIEKYKSNYSSKKNFDKDHQRKKSSSYSVYASLIVIFLSILVFIIGSSYDLDINVLVLIIAILITGGFFLSIARAEARAESTRGDVPAICSKCQNIMYCYKYTDRRASEINGIVYLCHNCNTKFIYSKPFSSGL